MSIELAERLKQEWTDQYVVVDEAIPELKRFAGRTGTVKTVNMNGYALVQFDRSEDIGWYDIDTSYLRKVDEPLPLPEPEEKTEPVAKKAAPEPAAAPKPSGGPGALDLARQQGAGGAAPAKALSPLEQARLQGSGGAAPATPAEAVTPPEPVAAPTPDPEPVAETAAPAASAPAGGPVSLSTDEVLALAREQGAFSG